MAEDNKLGRKITTLREAHHLTCQDLADRCGCEVEVIEKLEADESYGPAYISTEQMEEVERVKSLQTAKDAGDLSYFSLAAGRPSRHMDPFIITVSPTGEATHKLDSHEGEEWLYGMEGEIEIAYGSETYVLGPGESIYYDSIVPHQVRAHDGQKAKFLAVVYTPI